MRTECFLVGLFFVIHLQPVQAQQAAPSPSPLVLPKPILAEMPARSSWTIVEAGGAKDSSKPDGDAPRPALQKTFIKYDPLLEIIRIDGSGRQTTQWRVNGKQFAVSPSSDEVGVMDQTSDEYVKSDFQEIRWVSPSNFVGLDEAKGKKCWVFRSRVLQASPRELEDAMRAANEQGKKFDETPFYVEQTGYIDSATQLPVLLNIGGRILEYTINPPPTTPPVVPEALVKRLEADKSAEKAMKLGPARPF